MNLYDHIMDNYKSISDYAIATARNYPLVKRWCDKSAMIMFGQIYVPVLHITFYQDHTIPPMTSLEDHIKRRYDGNLTAASNHLGKHRNQLSKWQKDNAILIDRRLYLPKGLA